MISGGALFELSHEIGAPATHSDGEYPLIWPIVPN
ncbi:hypothetical protein ABIA38_004196 [Embleya sp. AB8]